MGAVCDLMLGYRVAYLILYAFLHCTFAAVSEKVRMALMDEHLQKIIVDIDGSKDPEKVRLIVPLTCFYCTSPINEMKLNPSNDSASCPFFSGIRGTSPEGPGF